MKGIIQFGKELYKRIADDDYFGLSAQLAYFFLLSLFPLLLFSITLVGYLPIDEHIVLELLNTVDPEESMEYTSSNLSESVNEQKSDIQSLSILGTCWSTSRAVDSMTI